MNSLQQAIIQSGLIDPIHGRNYMKAIEKKRYNGIRVKNGDKICPVCDTAQPQKVLICRNPECLHKF